MSPKIGYGVIGAGLRLQVMMSVLKQHGDKVAFVGACDPNAERLKKYQDWYGDENTELWTDYRNLLRDERISWVLIGSPNNLHKEHIIAALQAGKHVFAEKPLATSIDDAVEIYQECQNHTHLTFATGFVLRYSPLYQKVKSILAGGGIGKLLTISASENIPPEHGGHIMTNWRRYKEFSGSHILEKCCHDIDLLNWFVDSVPARVASFGGLNCFIPEHKDNMNRFPGPAGKGSVYITWDIPSRDARNPFTTQKSIVDNQIGILEYQNEVRVTFETTLNNAMPERRMRFTGTEGNMIAEAYSNTLQVKRIEHDSPMETYSFYGGDGHAGGDQIISDQLVDMMTNGAQPLCGGTEGLHSAIVSLSLEQARVENRIVEMEDIWLQVGRMENSRYEQIESVCG